MLASFYAFIMRIAAMAVLCALFECLIPQGKLKKTAQLCVGIVFVLSIALPVAQVLGEDIPSFSSTQQSMPAAQETKTHEQLLKEYYDRALSIE